MVTVAPCAVHLEPLASQHIDAYDRLFRGEPRIADLAGLPRLRSRKATEAWIRDGSRAHGCEPFAIVHEARGLVGAICLISHGSAGTFWFWIGAEHRNRGLGSQALALLDRAAVASFGIEGLFALVLSTNAASRRVLQGQGFRETGIALLPRREGVLVYADHRLAAAPALSQRIAAVLLAVDSRFRLAAPRFQRCAVTARAATDRFALGTSAHADDPRRRPRRTARNLSMRIA